MYFSKTGNETNKAKVLLFVNELRDTDPHLGWTVGSGWSPLLVLCIHERAVGNEKTGSSYTSLDSPLSLFRLHVQQRHYR